MTEPELRTIREDKPFAALVTFQVDRYWSTANKGWKRALRTLNKTRSDTVADAWQKIATLPPGKPANFYTTCVRNMILSQIRKGVSILRKREVAAAEAFLEASRQYIRVKGPRGWRTRRVVSLTPPDADDMTIGRNARSYLMGSPNPAPGRGKLDGLDQEDEAERGLVDNIP